MKRQITTAEVRRRFRKTPDVDWLMQLLMDNDIGNWDQLKTFGVDKRYYLTELSGINDSDQSINNMREACLNVFSNSELNTRLKKVGIVYDVENKMIMVPGAKLHLSRREDDDVDIFGGGDCRDAVGRLKDTMMNHTVKKQLQQLSKFGQRHTLAGMLGETNIFPPKESYVMPTNENIVDREKVTRIAAFIGKLFYMKLNALRAKGLASLQDHAVTKSYDEPSHMQMTYGQQMQADVYWVDDGVLSETLQQFMEYPGAATALAEVDILIEQHENEEDLVATLVVPSAIVQCPFWSDGSLVYDLDRI